MFNYELLRDLSIAAKTDIPYTSKLASRVITSFDLLVVKVSLLS